LKGEKMFLYESCDHIDDKRYYYEVYLNTEKSFTELEVRLVFRGIEPVSETVFDIDSDEIIKVIDKKISKIVEQHYKAHINYKGEADPKLLEDA